MRRAISVLTLFLALAALPAVAQAPNPDAPVSSADAVQATDTGAARVAPSPSTASGLPERAPQARTLRAYWHVFIAFAVTWVLLFGYALSVGRRFGRLEQSVQRLGARAD